jgi:hypothetical protein
MTFQRRLKLKKEYTPLDPVNFFVTDCSGPDGRQMKPRRKLDKTINSLVIFKMPSEPRTLCFSWFHLSSAR